MAGQGEARQGKGGWGDDMMCTLVEYNAYIHCPAVHKGKEKQDWLSPYAKGHHWVTHLWVNTHLVLELVQTE